MAGPKFDVSTEKGLAGFNGFMAAKSYMEGWSFSAADAEQWSKFHNSSSSNHAMLLLDASKYPHAHRWYTHITYHVQQQAGGSGYGSGPAQSTTTATATTRSPPVPPAPPSPVKKKPTDDDEEEDFDVFGEEDEDDDANEGKTTTSTTANTANTSNSTNTTESRADMLARLKSEAEARAASKELKQRTLVAIEIKPWDVEQDLMVLWKKITTTVTQDGLKWGENCTLADVAYGIKKIQTTFVMGVNNSSDDVVDAILAMEDEVQSCEVMSMSVL